MTYREFTIKKKNGKTRRICAPSPALLAYQRSKLPALSEKFLALEAATFNYPTMHGFVKNRNYVSAAVLHKNFKTTISLDITNFFDSVKVKDTSLEAVLSSMNIDIDKVTHKDGSLAQGFATSPAIANLALLAPMSKLDEALGQNFKFPFRLTVYADDIQVSIDSENYVDILLIKSLVEKIFKEHNLTVNQSKTRVHFAKYGNRRILGVQVGTDSISPNRRLKKKIRAARHQRNGPSLGGLVTASRLLLPKAMR